MVGIATMSTSVIFCINNFMDEFQDNQQLKNLCAQKGISITFIAEDVRRCLL